LHREPARPQHNHEEQAAGAAQEPPAAEPAEEIQHPAERSLEIGW
jgi:hypothetical protein